MITHEVGHHVLKLTGTSGKVDAMRNQMNTTQFSLLSVHLELQANCYAGVWAYHAHKDAQYPGAGGIEETMTAAATAGDGNIQMGSQGTILPESFTHGSAK